MDRWIPNDSRERLQAEATAVCPSPSAKLHEETPVALNNYSASFLPFQSGFAKFDLLIQNHKLHKVCWPDWTAWLVCKSQTPYSLVKARWFIYPFDSWHDWQTKAIGCARACPPALTCWCRGFCNPTQFKNKYMYFHLWFTNEPLTSIISV